MKKKILLIATFFVALVGVYNVYMNDKSTFSALAFENIEALAQWEWPEKPTGGVYYVECRIESYWDPSNHRYAERRVLICEGLGFRSCEC